MSRSQRLRMSDIAAVYRAADECRELGADARVWQRHMLAQVCCITGSGVGAVSQVLATPAGLIVDPATAVDIGWTDSERARTLAFITSGDYPVDEFCLRVGQRFVGERPPELTRTRRQLIDDAEWRCSETADAYRQLGVADLVMSLVEVPGRPKSFCVGFPRRLGEGPVRTRQVEVIELLCRLIRPHLGRGLTLPGEPGISELSPRRKQVLALLLDGLAEKQVARRLALSLPTVHEYTAAIYRHFGVNSRSELLAHFLRLRNGPPGEWAERFNGA